MSKEKKKTIIFTIALAVIGLILIGIFVVDILKDKGIISSKEVDKMMSEFNEVFKSEDRMVIYYASKSCSYCTLQTPILETIDEDYDMEYYYIDSSSLGAKQRNEILEKLEIEHATPTTVVVENGKVISKAVGYTQGKEYVEFFVDAEVLPEDAEYSAEKDITFIDYSDYEEIINDNSTNIVVVGQTSCSHCIAYKPTINSVAGDYDIVINYLNLTEMTEDESSDFFESLKIIGYDEPKFIESGSFGTPLTLIIENGKVKDYISGQRTYSQLVRELTRNNIISE